MRHGYYFSGLTRYDQGGEHTRRVRFTDFVFCEGGTWYHKPHGLRAAAKHAVEAGFKIHLSFQGGANTWARTIQQIRPFWAFVELVDLEDEPIYGRSGMQQQIVRLKEAIDVAELPQRPVGAVLTAPKVLGGDGWRAEAMDWTGIEGYLTVKQQGPGAAGKARKVLCDQLEVLPPNRPLVVVGMSMTRRGGWTHLPSLVAVQKATYDVAASDRRVGWLRWFNFAREDGALYHRQLLRAHRQIARKDRETSPADSRTEGMR